jgi:DNA repair protein RecO (recombination protein O)
VFAARGRKSPRIGPMALARDRCVCLRKTEFSETSQILALFGREHGIVRVIAKGAHRRTKAGASKFDGGVDTLDVGDAVFTLHVERDLNTLTEWGLRDGQQPLHRHLRAMYLGLYAAELVSTLIEEHDPHPELFDRLLTLLAELPTERTEESFLAFELDLLRYAGLLSDLSRCVGCGRPALEASGDGYFSPERGGLVCRSCEGTTPDRLRLDARLARLAQQVLRLPRVGGTPQRLPRLTRHQTDPLNALFARQVAVTLGRPLRMPAYVLA